MIQNQSMVNATAFAARLAAEGKVISALPGTPMGELVRLSTPILETTQATSPEAAEMYACMAADLTTGSLEAPTQHSLEMGALIDDVSKIVKVHISHAKNVVRPMVTELAEQIQTYLGKNHVKDASTQFTVEVLRLSAVLKDESFLDTLNYYKDRSVLEPDVPFALDTKTHDELMTLVLTGHDRTDRLITEWLSHKEDDFLVKIWNSFFTKNTGNVIYYADVNKMNLFEKSDFALAMFLIGRKITAQPEGASSLAAYKDQCKQYTDYAGALLITTLQRIAIAIRTKILVVQSDNRTKTAKVNGELYGKWLENGGSPEVILGLITSGQTVGSMELIDSKAAEYLKQWNSYCTFYKVSENNKSFDYFKTFVMNAFIESMKDKNETEVDYITKNPGYNDIINKKINEYLLNLKTPDMQDVYGMALYIVAGIRFYYTSAHQLLNDIGEASKANPNVDVREAALLATINYVADYLACQTVIEK